MSWDGSEINWMKLKSFLNFFLQWTIWLWIKVSLIWCCLKSNSTSNTVHANAAKNGQVQTPGILLFGFSCFPSLLVLIQIYILWKINRDLHWECYESHLKLSILRNDCIALFCGSIYSTCSCVIRRNYS